MYKKTVFLAMLLLVVFSMATVANATIYSSDYITRVQSDITVKSNGDLTINFSISSRNTMNQLGVKTIILQERANANSAWGEVKTFSYEDYSNMMRSNAGTHKSNVTFSNAISGYEYRAKVYFYAENGGYDTSEYITLAVTAK